MSAHRFVEEVAAVSVALFVNARAGRRLASTCASNWGRALRMQPSASGPVLAPPVLTAQVFTTAPRDAAMPMLKRTAFFLLLSLCAGQWPSASGTPEQNLPSVEVSLASPADPLPAVSAQIGGLDHEREAAEAAGMANAHRGFNEALRKASSRVDQLAERAARILERSVAAMGQHTAATALSFATTGGSSSGAPSQPAVVTVEVAHGSQVDGSVVEPLIGAFGSSPAEERSLFDSAIKGFDDLTDAVLSEVLAQVQQFAGKVSDGAASFAQTGFLAGELAPEQANVRVVAPEVPYPTVGSLVQDMTTRRSISSALVRARLLELDLSLLKRENELVRAALGDVAKHVLARMSFTARGA